MVKLMMPARCLIQKIILTLMNLKIKTLLGFIQRSIWAFEGGDDYK